MSEPHACMPDGFGAGTRCAAPAPVVAQGVIPVGLLQLGPFEAAIPTQYLREAVDCPPSLSRLASSSPHVAGALDLRGELIAVVDLRHALNLPPSTVEHPRIVIVQHRGFVFGIIVDALGGVIALSARQSQPVEVLKPSEAPLIREVFSIDDGRRVISMLCLDGVISQTDVPLTRAIDRAEHRHATRPDHHWTPCLLFEAGTTRLALNAHHVDTVLHLDATGFQERRRGHCLGLVQTDSRRLAVLDTLGLLGLGQSDVSHDRQVLVVRVGDDCVGLLIHHVAQISRMDDSTLRPIPRMAFIEPDLFDGMLPLAGHGDFLRIAVDRLLDLNEVSTLAQIHGRALHNTASSRQQQQQAMTQQVYLTFKVGHEVACALGQIREILPMPSDLTPIDRPGDPRVGLMTHRGQVIPVIDLLRLSGLPDAPPDADNRLLLLDLPGGGAIAFRVERVYAIEQARWSHAPVAVDQLRQETDVRKALLTRSLLTLGEASAQRGVPALDLLTLALAVRDQLQGPAPISPPADAPEPETETERHQQPADLPTDVGEMETA